jgi:hypothetical protein
MLKCQLQVGSRRETITVTAGEAQRVECWQSFHEYPVPLVADARRRMAAPNLTLVVNHE